MAEPPNLVLELDSAITKHRARLERCKSNLAKHERNAAATRLSIEMHTKELGRLESVKKEMKA